MNKNFLSEQIRRYYLPTEIYFGSGVLSSLHSILGAKTKSAFLVIDSYFAKNGIAEKVKSLLPNAKINVFDEVLSNPEIKQVEKLRSLIKDAKTDLIISIGGGSALDLGKSAAISGTNKGALIDFLTDKRKLTEKGIPFVAISTTAGTGSEVTPWATIWGEDKTKYSLASPLMFPLIAICDPELTLSAPRSLTACTGMDALSQAIEAYWSIHSIYFSDIHAIQGMSLAINYLEKAVNKPKELFYREQMMLAALETGRAFSQTKTTAVHSISYPMTAYFNIPHGYACGLSLSAFLKYNYNVTNEDCNDKRGPKFVKKRIMEIVRYLGCDTVDNACFKINNLMKLIGLETSLNRAGVVDIGTIIEHGFTQNRVANNPRLVTKENLKKLLKEIY